MSNDNIKGVSIILLTILGYIYYIYPIMHNIFDPITFWQKLAMLFTLDILSFVFTMVIASLIVGVINMIWETFTG